MARHLFSPITLRDIEFRNRIGVSPMCQYSAVNGVITMWHLVHLGARAAGGAGIVFTEALAVEPRGRISIHDAGLWSDEQIEPWGQINDFMIQQGAMPAAQIAHAGRKASTTPPWEDTKPLSENEGGWQPVAPSPLPWSEESSTPSELSAEEIKEIQAEFRAAAARARTARFRMLEVHGAHGYLIHSFLSPITNQRTDEYGGEFKNRIRFLVETVREVRKEWPEDKPLSVRLSCSDWVEGGWTPEESIELASKLKWEGVDLIDCSSGGIMPGVHYHAGASWQVPFAADIKRKAGIATAAVGVIVEPMQADAIIRNQRVDIVLLGREMLRNPNWPYKAARRLNKEHLLSLPQQYAWAIIKK